MALGRRSEAVMANKQRRVLDILVGVLAATCGAQK
jgi:hypothetical protein